jgi:hypothetical protein
MSRFNPSGTAAAVNAMRAILASGMLITWCASADAATAHHLRTHPHHLASRSADSFAYEPARPLVHAYAPGDNEAPSDHEASTYGGVILLPDD